MGKLKTVRVSQVVRDKGWSLFDGERRHNLRMSVKRFGQLRPVVTRQVGEEHHVLDGRELLEVLEELGIEEVDIYDAGPLTDGDALIARIALDNQRPKDHVLIAHRVADAVRDGLSLEALHAATPYTPEMVDRCRELAAFDFEKLTARSPKSTGSIAAPNRQWSVFGEDA